MVSVPLLPGDPDALLDLQQARTTVHDSNGYDELHEYSGRPPGPLTPAEAAWVEGQLRPAGRRAP